MPAHPQNYLHSTVIRHLSRPAAGACFSISPQIVNVAESPPIRSHPDKFESINRPFLLNSAPDCSMAKFTRTACFFAGFNQKILPRTEIPATFSPACPCCIALSRSIIPDGKYPVISMMRLLAIPIYPFSSRESTKNRFNAVF